MDQLFISNREVENLFPLKLNLKDNFLSDLDNINYSWTGRTDVMFANNFFREATQLIVNAIYLFERGYFDCAFYSLRQSLEISTTIAYFVDDSEQNRGLEMQKWTAQEKFPMHVQMLKELENRKQDFADIKSKMGDFFNEIDQVKHKLNKYVHKQGYDKFYIAYSNLINRENASERLTSDFETFLVKSIGAVAVFRLVIDPFPILLTDPAIYNRTEDMMTEKYTDDFISKYIGSLNIEQFKRTDLYTSHYNALIAREEKLPSVLDIVKDLYIDRSKSMEILSQKHLLSTNDRIAFALSLFSLKIAKIHCVGGFIGYHTDIKSLKRTMSFSSIDFERFNNCEYPYNTDYDGVYLSAIKIFNELYFIEHNEIFNQEEIDGLDHLPQLIIDNNPPK